MFGLIQLIALRCFGLNQIIGGCLIKFAVLISSDCKQSAGCMAVFISGQGFYHFAIRIPQFKFCIFQCCSGILICFLNDQTSLCGVIFHGYLLDLCGICHLEGDLLCNDITVWSLLFFQGVFTNRKFFDIMRLFTGSPGFYDVAIFICDGQFGSFDLIISGNIRFADLHFGHIIFHYLFLDLYSILHGECDAFRSGISIGRLGFCQGVRFSYNQFFDDVRLLGGCPFLNNSPVFIRQL